jgi:hypothetical protein
VPTLKEAIQIIQGKDFKFFADVRGTAKDHPYHGQEEEIVLKLFEEMEFSDQVGEE